MFVRTVCVFSRMPRPVLVSVRVFVFIAHNYTTSRCTYFHCFDAEMLTVAQRA